jgi:hypothetical protein
MLFLQQAAEPQMEAHKRGFSQKTKVLIIQVNAASE